MFLHDPMTVDIDTLTTRELKELINLFRKQSQKRTKDEMKNLASDIVGPVYTSFSTDEMKKYHNAIVKRLISEFGTSD